LVRLTVVFVDVRGFSALSEKPNLQLSSVFTLDGTLDKMVGDGVMAFFGAPFQPEDHALGRCSQNWRLCQAFSPVQKILKDYPLVVALPQAKYSWET
jgi:class 3 adenylate cyclase